MLMPVRQFFAKGDQEKGRDRSKEERQQKPIQTAPVLALRKSRVDQSQRSPTNSVARQIAHRNRLGISLTGILLNEVAGDELRHLEHAHALLTVENRLQQIVSVDLGLLLRILKLVLLDVVPQLLGQIRARERLGTDDLGEGLIGLDGLEESSVSLFSGSFLGGSFFLCGSFFGRHGRDNMICPSERNPYCDKRMKLYV